MRSLRRFLARLGKLATTAAGDERLNQEEIKAADPGGREKSGSVVRIFRRSG